MLANRLKTLNPYKPGEQLKDRDYIKLNANENAFPPPKEIVEEITNLLNTNLSALSLYPDPDSTDLRLEIANFLNKTGGVLANVEDAKSKLDFEITKDMIFCGNGSDYWPCSHSRAIPSFPSQLEWKIGLAWANTRGILNSPS